MKSFLFIATFQVDTTMSPGFQKWMEDTHFPQMVKTNCFVHRHSKVLDMESEKDKGFHTITYSHEVVDGEEGWRIYNEEFRPAIRKEFIDRYFTAMSRQQLTCIMCVGWQETI